jgi:TolB-like protein/Tfp pilus assembly protein PilF
VIPAAVIPAPVARTHGQHAIAVLPLDNFSANPGDAYFADGMTEVLIADLAQLEGWRVISRTSAESYRDSKKPLTQIARELNVDLVVEGSVTKIGDRVRVTVQLIDADLDQHLFARSYDRTTEDLLALQNTLALEIAQSLKAAIAPAHETRLAKREAVNPAVYDLYLRGRHASNQRTPESLAAAIDYFSEAAKLDPTFALAQVGLADAHSMAGSPSTGVSDAQAQMSRARSAAEQALRLDGQLAEAHAALGGVQFFGDRDAVAAEQSFKRAIALNPNYPVAHEWYAVLLSERGRDAEAREHADTALSLDPVDATMHQARGLVDYYAHRYIDAAAAERRALVFRPQLPFARIVLIKALIMKGDSAAAVSLCDSINAFASDQTDLVLNCGIALQRNGDPRASVALARLQAMKPLPETALAQWYAATGDLGRAFALLTKLHASGNLPPNLAFDPLFEALRADPRYAPLRTTH